MTVQTWLQRVFKVNGPGKRQMLIFDEKGRDRKFFGGYSSKFYDGNFVELIKDWIKKT